MVPTLTSSASAEAGIADLSWLSLPVQLVLEVTKGQTRFRRRPVTSPRFLIGAGSTCDLRLGGAGMSALHSIITIAGREIAIEAIAAEPALTVNGRLVQNSVLHDGDVITVGEVELLARLEATRSPVGALAASLPAALPADVERPAADFSAAELIDLIEQEERLIEDFEERQRVGANALVEAIMGRARRPAVARPADAGIRAPIPAPHFLSKRPQILVAQTRQTFLNISQTLAQAGASWSDVVEITSYRVGLRAQSEVLLKVAPEFLDKPYPAWTDVGITELFEPDAVVEISCVAIIRTA